MEFCEECGNMLLPKKGTLFCRICKKEFKVKQNVLDTYKVKKKTNKGQRRQLTQIIEDHDDEKIITEDDRAAYEEYFIGGGDGTFD
jgi:DNA-directed RNA polymerase subunit M/transcription elongation factor TFIIS